MFKPFSDLSIEEFKRYNGYKRTSARRNDPLPSFQSGITPDAFDWRENKGVSPVKNQALCGSSYAFGAVAAIESQYLVKKGQELDLSEEDVLQCTYHAPEYGNNQGCVDGETEAILRYVRDHGIASERTDPYNPDADFPNCKKDEPVVANLSQAIQANNVDEAVLLRDIVYHVGPVAVVIDASKLVGYESGIISGTQGQWRVNRAALLVGYGEENGVKYWALKNSWGETWGEDGFFRIERGSNVMGITEEIDIAIL
uniref:Pept_C1 domain-containing protein n=1 Tax=Bursaphelenchus xylophilus TaxID=6326 RepID=A0A1I7SJ85_BURXY